MEEFGVMASVMLASSICPVELFAAARVLAINYSWWVSVLVSPVPPIVALSVNAPELRGAKGAPKGI